MIVGGIAMAERLAINWRLWGILCCAVVIFAAWWAFLPDAAEKVDRFLKPIMFFFFLWVVVLRPAWRKWRR